ncbi:hypothetical protein yc1106_06099 [Curvularia clavata]|uniref:F-box domain-containing protein n=1 Tax=Curvularia clavata TaxID=95742 RepID=A0A9Q8ZAV6_CURCL|nr:hypothetical protein yc1106_06099 [Curvularia clavata]
MTLISLPNELIEHIASYLDLPSIRSLRLTTSSITRATSHLFRDRFFYQHTLTWTKQSLDTLVEISLHPNYGTALRHLIINATPQHSMHFWRLRKSISEIDDISTPYGGVKPSAQRQLEAEQVLAEQKIKETTTFFNETRYDQKMLKQAFSNLSKLPGGSSLTRLTFLYNGLSAAYSGGSPLYCQLSQCEMSRPFVSTLAALASSPDIHISDILLSRDAPHGAVSIGRLESLAPSLTAFDKAFASLQHLALNLRDWRRPDGGFTLPTSTTTTRPPFIVRFLSKATHLRSLELSCFSWLDPDLFTQIARLCVFPDLQSLKLSVLSLSSAQALSNFLMPAMSKDLRCLKIRHVLLVDREVEWDDWLAWLASIGTGTASTVQGEAKDEDRTRSGTGITHLCIADLFRPMNEVIHFQGKRGLCFGEDWASRLRMTLEDEGVEVSESRLVWSMGAFAYPFVGLSM